MKKYSFLLPALLSGVLLIAAFPPFEQGYLAWFALLPFIISLLKLNPRRAFLAGAVFGLPLHLYLNFYLTSVLFPYLPTALAFTAIISLIIYISIYHGLFALAASLINRLRIGWFTALALPSLWLITEYIRSVGFMGYNVGYIGYSQWNYPALLNITSVYGYWGLPFIMVLFQSIIALALLNRLKVKHYYLVSVVFIILFATGLLFPTAVEMQEEMPLKAAFIQGNISPEIVVGSGRDNILNSYLDLTEKALEENRDLDLVVWPETVVDIIITSRQEHPEAMRQIADDYEVNILYGARLRKDGDLFNSIVLLTEGDENMKTYYKHRLVPFVEFFPMEDLLNRILQLNLLLGSYSEGEDLTIFNLDGTPFAGVVCFESYFGDHLRLLSAKGARHIFILTNDAWFGESIGLELHAQAAAIRAAESGVGVTQVANSGITISFDHYGRELFRSGKNEPDIFIRSIEMARRDTLYVRFGDYLPAAATLFIVTVLLILLYGRRLHNN